MNSNTQFNTEAVEGTEFDDRDARALVEHITVVPTYDGTGDVEGVSESGRTCRIDTDALEGDCPDAEYNCSDGRCKHARRYEFAAQIRELPEWIDEAAITQPFGEHIEPAATPDTDGGRPVAADGGVTVREAATDAELLEDDDVDPWEGPFAEYDRYGHPTGTKFRRCRDCGREVVTDAVRDHVEHRDGCKFGDS